MKIWGWKCRKCGYEMSGFDSLVRFESVIDYDYRKGEWATHNRYSTFCCGSHSFSNGEGLVERVLMRVPSVDNQR